MAGLSDGMNSRLQPLVFLSSLSFTKKNGELKINDNALTAISLLIASSNPSEKELMISLVINSIKD